MKKTSLFEKHLELNAKMVDFGGFNMPIQYSGISDEHINVRNNVGIFDVSHMGEFFVSGKEALQFLNHVCSNNIEKIEETLGKKKKKNLSKFIDIDILDFGGIIRKDQLVLPHPRLHLRLFVLAPLKEVSPCWEHPVYKKNIY